MIPRSVLASVPWPAVPSDTGSVLLALQHQFRHSERLPADALEQLQLQALSSLLRHACATVPYYRDNVAYREAAGAEHLDMDLWRTLPVISRALVQEAGSTMVSESIPADHLPTNTLSTSGSTGRPLRALTTRVTAVYWQAITLRELLWRGRDFSGRWASIRTDSANKIPPQGRTFPAWGPPASLVYQTGPSGTMGVQYDVATQASWLMNFRPDYLLSLPSNLVALARHFLSTGNDPEGLRGVVAYGETLTPEARSTLEGAWNVPLCDMYSSQELGYLALQCPESECYHVQCESAMVEILDDDLRPCAPGEVGRVVASSLHNYAMPLIRYEVGDFARVGESCPCGRTLPVIERIMGRARNMLVLPGGTTVWPTFGQVWREIAGIRQLQLVQRELDWIEARVVAERVFSSGDEDRFAEILHERFGHPFRVTFTYLDGIDRAKNAKFEDFVSLVAAPS